MNRHGWTASLAGGACLLFLAACGNAPTVPAETGAAAATAEASGPAQRRADGSAPARAGADRTYEVTIENLTSGQPLTPPLLATHRGATDLFEVGEPASFEVKEIAENGNLAPMTAALGSDPHVSDVVTAVAGTPPPLLPGQRVTVHIGAEPGARFLSFASMLICTNDGFTGLDRRRLPARVGEGSTLTTNAYDAGTERNTEDFADLVPPCPVLTGVPSSEPGSGTSDPALAENGVIHPHAGIRGHADLSVAVHDWTDPVAKVTVRRIR